MKVSLETWTKQIKHPGIVRCGHRVYHTPRRSLASTSHGTRHQVSPNQLCPWHSGIKKFPVRLCSFPASKLTPDLDIVTIGKGLDEVLPHSARRTRPERFQLFYAQTKSHTAGTLTSINEIAESMYPLALSEHIWLWERRNSWWTDATPSLRASTVGPSLGAQPLISGRMGSKGVVGTKFIELSQ